MFFPVYIILYIYIPPDWKLECRLILQNFLTSQVRMCLVFFRMRPPMGSQKQSKYPELAWENSFFLSLILAASTDDGGTK